MYRVKQFIWALQGTFKSVDYKFIQKYLDKDEIELFKRLKNSEQHHCVRVCQNTLREIQLQKNIDTNEICKMALLHDVGKIKYPLNIIDKSMIVILDKLSKGKLKNYSRYKRVNSYYNHPKESVRFLKELKKYETEFLYVIEHHHQKLNEEDNIYLKIIKKCDDIS